jgi:hypothetical protein
MRIGITMALLCAVAMAQTPPDAPSASKPVCYQWSLDYLHNPSEMAYHEIPCSSFVQTTVPPAPRATLLTWDRGTSPLRTRTFDMALALESLSTFADAAITHHRAGQTHSSGHLCVEANTYLAPQPTNAALWRQDAIPLAAQSALLWVVGRYTWLPITWGSFAYGTVIHARGAYSWHDCR